MSPEQTPGAEDEFRLWLVQQVEHHENVVVSKYREGAVLRKVLARYDAIPAEFHGTAVSPGRSRVWADPRLLAGLAIIVLSVLVWVLR